MTETLLKVSKNMSLLNLPAYSTGVVNDWNNIESGKKHEPPEPPCLIYNTGVIKDWNIIESGKKHEPPEPPCLIYNTGAVNDWNNIESGIVA
jgi:hypothetical protein